MQEDSQFTQLLEAVRPYIENYGLGAVAAAMFLETLFLTGYLFPSMLVLIGAGYFAAEGTLSIWQVYFAALGAAIVGDNASYAAGRFIGQHFLKKHRARAEKIRAALNEEKPPLLLWYQYATLVRPIVPLTAGYSRYSWRRFIMLDSLGLAGWIAFMCLSGYLAGSLFRGADGWVSWTLRGVALVATLLVFWRIWVRVKSWERETRAPEDAGGNDGDGDGRQASSADSAAG